MKKTLIAAAAAVALTASAFADITFGSWLRTLPTFVASNGDDTVAYATNSWGGSARTARIQFSAAAEDGNAGFDMMIFDPMSGDLSDSGSARMWVKPVEQVKLSVGSFSPDNNVGGYRRDFAYGAWNWVRSYSTWITDGEGYLIDGVGDWSYPSAAASGHRTGALVEVTPVEGLNAYAFVPFAADGSAILAEDTYKMIQIGGNYAIDGVGLLSAVFIGANDKDPAGDVTKTGTIEAAFELTSVENLYVGAGFKMPIQDADKVAADADKMALKLAVSYQVNADAKVYANGGYYMYNKGKDDAGKDPRFEAAVGVDYNLGDGLSANVDVRYTSKTNDADNSDNVGLLAGVTKGISSNGLIGIAFQGKTNGNGDKFIWGIPVRVEMWF